jgi:predicted alpha/beta-fold hydrolase
MATSSTSTGTLRTIATADDRPLLVLFHGLEGSSGSHYASTLMRAVTAIGWAGVVVNFRGCSGESNRLPRAYHSGDSDEIDWILRRLQALFPSHPRYAVGVSLGGNALLKWLGERERGAYRHPAGGRRDQRTARPRRLRSRPRQRFQPPLHPALPAHPQTSCR